jgi:hypothetical protein
MQLEEDEPIKPLSINDRSGNVRIIEEYKITTPYNEKYNLYSFTNN